MKPGPKAVIITRSGRPRFEQPFEHEQHRRRAHVAVVAQHLALEVELALVELERGLDRVDHLHPAGVAAEAVDVVARDAELRAHLVDRLGELGLDERRDGAVEHDGEAGVLDVPAHDPERVGPQLLGRARDASRGRASPAVTTAAAAPSPNKAVATTAAGSSLSRRIEIEQVSTVTNSQLLPGSDAASRAASRKAADAAGAAEAEDRHPADVGTQADARADARFEAGGRDAGRRDGDDAVDLARAAGPPARSP